MLKRLLPGNGHHNETPASYFSTPYESLAPPSPWRVNSPSFVSSTGQDSSSGYFDYPANQSKGNSRAGTPLGSRPTSPFGAEGIPSAVVNEEPPDLEPILNTGTIDRSSMLKSMKAIESLLEALSQLNDLQQALNKCQKKIMKGCKDLAHVLSEDTLSKEEIADNVLINTLLCASNIFGAFHEVTKTTAKNTEKEYNTLQDVVTKAFKKIVKEERAHDEHLDALENKIQKANYNFDKHRKPAKKSIGMSGGHSNSQDGTVAADRYYASISSLGLDVTKSKAAHSSVLHYRRESLCRIFCKSLFHVADNEWTKSCSEVRKVGVLIGQLTMWANFCTSDGMPKKIPVGHQEEESMSVRSPPLQPDSSRLAGSSPHLQGNSLEKMKENIDYTCKTPAFKSSSPAAVFPPESLSSSTYPTQGLGLVRSSSKTLGPRPNPRSLSSGPHLSASLGPSRPPMEHANTHFYSPQLQHQVEQTSREALIQKEHSHTHVKSEASLATVFSNATAPLAVRKNSRNSQLGMSPRPEDYDVNIGNAFSSANQNQISSHLLRSLNHEDLSKFDFLSRMTPEQLSNIRANNRAMESHRATIELSRLIDHKLMGSHFAEPADHIQSPTQSEFLGISQHEGIPEYGPQLSRTSLSAIPTRQSSAQDEADIDYSAAAAVGAKITQNDELNSRESDASSFLDRQSSIASVGSTRSKVSEIKYLYSKQNQKDLDPASTSQIPTQVATAILEQSTSHGSSVAALASRFSALADPYMRQFETEQPTKSISISRQGPTSTIPQHSKNANPCLHEGVIQPPMRSNHNHSTGHSPLLPNRSLAQSNLQQFRMMGQQTKSQDKDAAS